MMKQLAACLVLITLITSCSSTHKGSMPSGYPVFYKEGHRGTRGLMPENTIPAMIKGIETGANVIEVDIYITGDGKVLVAHDPYPNINHTLDANGQEISKEDAGKYVWRQMNYKDIRRFDVGSKYYAAYPQQQKLVTYMPLLGELIDSVEAYTARHHLPGTIYNIELKTSVKADSLGQNAGPEEMVQKVMEVVQSKPIGNRFYIQSFDMRPLQIVHREYPSVVIGFLTGDAKISLEENLDKLGFTPEIYSPHYALVTPAMVEACKSKKMKLVPWTVNTREEMEKLIAMGVNGIITDYPDILSELTR